MSPEVMLPYDMEMVRFHVGRFVPEGLKIPVSLGVGPALLFAGKKIWRSFETDMAVLCKV